MTSGFRGWSGSSISNYSSLIESINQFINKVIHETTLCSAPFPSPCNISPHATDDVQLVESSLCYPLVSTINQPADLINPISFHSTNALFSQHSSVRDQQPTPPPQSLTTTQQSARLLRKCPFVLGSLSLSLTASLVLSLDSSSFGTFYVPLDSLSDRWRRLWFAKNKTKHTIY